MHCTAHNTDKAKVVVCRRDGHLALGERWSLDGKELEDFNQYKYFGFNIFTTKLFIETTLNGIAVRGKQKDVHVLRALWRLRGMSTITLTNLIDTRVLATLLYGSEITMGSTEKYKYRKKTHVPRTPNHMLYGGIGRYPHHIQQH